MKRTLEDIKNTLEELKQQSSEKYEEWCKTIQEIGSYRATLSLHEVDKEQPHVALMQQSLKAKASQQFESWMKLQKAIEYYTKEYNMRGGIIG